MRILMLVAIALTAAYPTAGIAGPQSYQCEIKEMYMLNEDASLTRPAIPYLIGAKFAIDRDTGALVGPDKAMWSFKDSRIEILSRGNSSNGFVVTIASPAAESGVHSTFIEVHEFANSKRKPFVVMSGNQILTGSCK